MKNKTYLLGICCTLVILTGSLFKIFHWAGAGILFTAGIILFCLVFLPFAIRSSYRADNENRLPWIYAGAIISVVMSLAGALFKVMHWNGAGTLILIGIPLPFVIFLPFYIFYRRDEKQINYNHFLAVLFFFAYVGAMSALLALNVSRNVLYDTTTNIGRLQSKTEVIRQVNSMLILSEGKQDERANRFNSAVDSVCNSIGAVRGEMIGLSTGKNPAAESLFSDYESLNEKDNTTIPEKVIFSHGNTINLEKQVNRFMRVMKPELGQEHLPDFLKSLLETEAGKQYSWTRTYFQNRNLVSTLELLFQLEYEIRLVQNAILMKKIR